MGASSRGLPGDTRIGRVRLRVSDHDRTSEFYQTVIGLHPISRRPDHTVLGGSETPLLELHQDPNAAERPDEAAGLFHTAFRVPNRGALGDALERIEQDWHLDGASDHRVSEALYLTDPEGNGVEVYHDWPADEWPTTDAGQVAMDTLPLDLTPLRQLGTGAPRVPAGTDIGHIHLEVTSLAAAQSFYADGLGMNVRQRFGDSALFLAAGDYHHHVGANIWNGRTAPRAGRGLEWFELLVPGVDALEAVHDRLAAAGHPVTRTTDGLDVADPDDISLRLRVLE